MKHAPTQVFGLFWRSDYFFYYFQSSSIMNTSKSFKNRFCYELGNLLFSESKLCSIVFCIADVFIVLPQFSLQKTFVKLKSPLTSAYFPKRPSETCLEQLITVTLRNYVMHKYRILVMFNL